MPQHIQLLLVMLTQLLLLRLLRACMQAIL
jgi:hypothetical protein